MGNRNILMDKEMQNPLLDDDDFEEEDISTYLDASAPVTVDIKENA